MDAPYRSTQYNVREISTKSYLELRSNICSLHWWYIRILKDTHALKTWLKIAGGKYMIHRVELNDKMDIKWFIYWEQKVHPNTYNALTYVINNAIHLAIRLQHSPISLLLFSNYICSVWERTKLKGLPKVCYYMIVDDLDERFGRTWFTAKCTCASSTINITMMH